MSTKIKPETLAYQILPQFFLEILARYFRLQVEGLENLPKRGGYLIAANHSGFSGLDALILRHQVKKATGREPRVLTHHLWFLTKATAIPASKMGFIEATMANGLKFLKKRQPVVIFPEGEYGNFKPTTNAYVLQEFKRGFVRMALMSQVPIVPVLIIGAEETHINLSQLKFAKYLRGLVLPLPLNIVPLPAKWRIQILPPVRLPYKAESAEDSELTAELSEEIRESMQTTLNQMLAKRGSVYF